MVTLGIDLASQPKRTATCLIRWDRGSARVEALSLGATDADLHELFGRADRVGIDAPFGWPASFTRAVAAYSSETVWPSVGVPQLRFRRTDEVVRGKAGSMAAQRLVGSDRSHRHASSPVARGSWGHW